MAQCGAPTRDGTLCGLLVTHEGQRCYRHESPDAANRRIAAELAVRGRTTPEVVVPDQVSAAVDHCGRLLTSERWRDTVARKVISHVPDHTWGALLTSTRPDRCLTLANAAADVLIAGKSPQGSLARRTRVALGFGRAEQVYARQLAKRITLPAAPRATAVARGLQVTGVLLCMADGGHLGGCQCFLDLARTELKHRVRQILMAAAQDWVTLALFPGRWQRGRTLGETRPLRPRAELDQPYARRRHPELNPGS